MTVGVRVADGLSRSLRGARGGAGCRASLERLRGRTATVELRVRPCVGGGGAPRRRRSAVGEVAVEHDDLRSRRRPVCRRACCEQRVVGALGELRRVVRCGPGRARCRLQAGELAFAGRRFASQWPLHGSLVRAGAPRRLLPLAGGPQTTIQPLRSVAARSSERGREPQVVVARRRARGVAVGRRRATRARRRPSRRPWQRTIAR